MLAQYLEGKGQQFKLDKIGDGKSHIFDKKSQIARILENVITCHKQTVFQIPKHF